MGFGVSISNRSRRLLRDWTEYLLEDKIIVPSGYFKNQTYKKKWHYYLWDILMFEAWREEEKL